MWQKKLSLIWQLENVFVVTDTNFWLRRSVAHVLAHYLINTLTIPLAC